MSTDVDTIKSRLDLAEVIKEYVPLRQMGQHFKALCPFHQEKTPSFVVSPIKGMWHCFGCGEGGDIFAFVQKIEGLDFPATLKLLAERAGVQLSGRVAPGSLEKRQRAYDLLALASRFYEEILQHQTAGEKARTYLRGRGIAERTSKDFRIGYAPEQWNVVQRFLHSKGFTLDELLAAGLVGRGVSGRVFDRFRGRIIFPIADVQGRVVAFGGRITPWTETGKEGKYINSPETDLYSKRRTIYNLDRAKQALRGGRTPCIVVEGYMDVVMLVQAGIGNVVASSGTAFTPEHITQLKRFTPTLHFAFDADQAGWKAALAATQGALHAGMRVAVIPLPAGKDPADVSKEYPKDVRDIFARTSSLVALALAQLRTAAQVGASDVQEQLQALLPLIQQVANPVQQGEMIREVAEALHIPEPHMMRLVERSAGKPVPAFERIVDDGTDTPTSPERHFLGLLILEPSIRAELFPQVRPEVFLDNEMRQLYTNIQTLAEHRADFFAMLSDDLITHLPAEHVALAEAVRMLSSTRQAQSSFSSLQEAKLLWRALQKRALERQLRSMQQELARTDDAHRSEMLQRFQAMAEELEQVKAQI